MLNSPFSVFADGRVSVKPVLPLQAEPLVVPAVNSEPPSVHVPILPEELDLIVTLAPGAPSLPFSPLEPFAPALPCGPVPPAGPVGPAGPVAPVAPLGPAGPR